MSEVPIVFSCATCSAEAMVQKELKHTDDCKKKAVTRHCKH